jgi:hypothetical protein
MQIKKQSKIGKKTERLNLPIVARRRVGMEPMPTRARKPRKAKSKEKARNKFSENLSLLRLSLFLVTCLLRQKIHQSIGEGGGSIRFQG